jgi:hypothetical protein
MNQPSPEQIQALMAAQQQQPQQPQGLDPNHPAMAATGGHPMAEQVDQIPSPSPLEQVQQGAEQTIDPMDILPDFINQIINWGLGIIHDNTLDKQVQSKIILEQAQALAQVVPLVSQQNQSSVDPQQAQLEMAIKAQQHEQEMQIRHEKHQTELQIAQEKHAMEMQKAQHDLQLALVQNQQKMQHQEVTHRQQLVQKEEAHKTQLQQQKQAAQSKQSNKQGSNKGKKQ